MLLPVVPKVHEAISEEGDATAEGPLTKAAESMCKQLEWYAHALKNEREVRLSTRDISISFRTLKDFD